MLRMGLTAVALWTGLWAGFPSAQAAFFAAAGKVDITPDLAKHSFYLAGYGAAGRPISGVHDPLYARGFVVSDGTHTVGMIVVDVLGLYREDVEAIRKLALTDPSRESLLVAASHTHSGPDTIGLWGRYVGVSGVVPDYQELLHERVAGLYRELAGRLKEARIRTDSRVLDPKGLVRDMRDPRIIDAELRAVEFLEQGKKGRPIGVLVNWSCHAESVGEDNREITADFPGVLCGALEKDYGACAWFPGAIGGMMSPDVRRDTLQLEYEERDRIGRTLADDVRSILKRAPLVEPKSVSYRSRIVRVPIENARYLDFLPSLRFGHKVYDARGRLLGAFGAQLIRLRHLLRPLGPGTYPQTETEVSRIDLGPAEILAVPGELFPELFIGGYDGRYSYGRPIIGPDNKHPPDLSQAPRGPYLRDFMTGRPKLIFGLANDMLGYIMPGYDFKVTPGRSMLPKPPGQHYEETNSTGRDASRMILEAAQELLKEP